MISRKTLLKKLKNNDVIIWGARMTGLGALRYLRSNNINPVCFTDSDKAFSNKTIKNLPVISPKNLSHKIKKNKWNPLILVAVSLKEEEILLMSKLYSLDSFKFYSFQSSKSPYFTVDILSSCNLKCLSCPHSLKDKSDAPKGSMSLSTAKNVIDKIKLESPETTHISLYSWGEPLIHPKIDQIVHYAHSKNMAVALSSNLSINFSDNKLEKLIKSEPDYIKISVSGFYPEAYNTTHQGGDINLVKSNLRKIHKYILKHKSNTLIDINYHLYRNNNGKNLQKFKELANELGFILSTTYALVMPLERVFNKLDGKKDLQTETLEKNLLVDINEGIRISSQNIPKKSTCPFRENQININADLSVPICCVTFNKSKNIVSNNYLDTSLQKISKKKNKISTCKKCMQNRLPEYNMGYNRDLWEKIADTKLSLDH